MDSTTTRSEARSPAAAGIRRNGLQHDLEPLGRLQRVDARNQVGRPLRPEQDVLLQRVAGQTARVVYGPSLSGRNRRRRKPEPNVLAQVQLVLRLHEHQRRRPLHSRRVLALRSLHAQFAVLQLQLVPRTATYRAYTLGLNYIPDPDLLFIVTAQQRRDFPIAVPGLFPLPPLNVLGQYTYTPFLGMPPYNITGEVRARVAPTSSWTCSEPTTLISETCAGVRTSFSK